jgi:ABC-type antimicrobial peptide transport system permease subunit
VANATGLAGVPDALVAFLAVLTAAVLAHALVLVPRRRARDLAVLRALGLTPRGVVACVLVAAGTVALVGLFGGVPLGLLVGRVLWAETARAIGVATDAAPPVRGLALLVPATLLGALLVAAIPALVAARRRDADALRDE